ncbi:MAG: proton-conducting transporter membrane subunit, partial [Candidatus Omnitrophota bacterium]|nr:proton-conducting transporter membrane subunit [Candidatus Omnitrophota bacterium]
SYMEKYTEKWKFYTLFLLMLAGMEGVIITGDLFNLFVFLEIASVASYALVAYGTEAEELEASFKYLVMSSVGSMFVLLGVALIYGYTSTLNMADIAATLAQKGPGRVMQFVSVLFIMGFGLKSALVPFHAWLPDAHPSAPAPISAMLSGVLIKALGVYALIRLFYNMIGADKTILHVFIFLGALSMIAGVFLAIGQWDLKRLLAYHSISQIGYVMLGFGIGTPLGILGGLFHLFNHSVFKSLLFLNAGAVEYSAGTRDLKKMGGLRQRMPVTADTSLIASMSIAGIPPFNGFWSKFIIVLAAVQAGRIWFAFAAIVASVLTLASFMKVQRYAFFGALGERNKLVREAPLSMRFSMIMLALICVAGALLLSVLYKPFLGAAQGVVMGGPANYVKTVFEAMK